MRASEWQYLCAVHDPPKSCCAIDYCCHTLDWATNTLTSPKYFPSRLTLGSEAGGGPQASMRHLTNIFRRLYRIFAHAWFQHRDVFWEVEGHDGLYVFFKTVCDLFHLIPEDNYTIPPEAEGPEAVQLKAEEPTESKRLTILRKENEPPFSNEVDGVDPSLGTGATTRRHKHSPSTGSRVTTITESAEDHDDVPRTAAPLREVMKESPEPRPPSAVENRPADEDPAPEAESTPTEDSSVAKETADEQHEEITAEKPEETKGENPETPEEPSKEEPTSSEVSEKPEETAREHDVTEVPEESKLGEESTEQADEKKDEETEAEKPLEGEGEGEETPAVPANDGPSDSSQEPEGEAAAEPEPKTEE